MTEVLVVDWRPAQFADTAARFPQVTFRVSESFEQAAAHLATASVLVSVGRDLTPELVQRMPSLEWMHCLISGTDRAVAALAQRPEVVLTSTRGIHGPQMAEAALCHMLCLAREVPRSVRNQDARRWERWDPLVLGERTVGIVGLGLTGEHIARACSAVGMDVVGVSRTPRELAGVARVFTRERLAEAAALADFLVLTVPLAPDTERLIDARVLAAMKSTAYLINLARGEVVDTDALLDALRSGQIAGAGLDVFDSEPLPPGSPLWELDNVFLTAHLGGRSDRYIRDAMTIFEPNLRRWVGGERAELRNLVAR